MKIIYSAGNRIGANTQLSRFLDNIDKTKHEVKTAAYLKSSHSIFTIDWMLNAIHKNKPKNLIPTRDLNATYYNRDIIDQLLNDVADFNPDLIISDHEHIFGHIAHEMNIPLWYCSPMLLIEGINWPFGKKIRYSYFVNLNQANKNNIFPVASKYLIYSPFCDLKKQPELKITRDDDWSPIHKYNWVRPYYRKTNIDITIDEIERIAPLNNILNKIDLNNYYFTDGNTDNISDAIYNKRKIIISPSVNNREALINSVILNKYKIGADVGQIELMKQFALDEMDNAFNLKLNKIQLANSKSKQLHEMIDEFANKSDDVDIME